MFSVPKRNTGKCFERSAKIFRGMQSSVPKRNTGKCLLTVGTDVKNVTEGRGMEGRGMEGRGGKEGTRLIFTQPNGVGLSLGVEIPFVRSAVRPLPPLPTSLLPKQWLI